MQSVSKPIYLDYNATTPVDPEVLKAMDPYLKREFGNPSSSHLYGRTSKEAVEKARSQVASFISAAPEEIVFTSGGSESDNTAIFGAVFASMRSEATRKGGHMITSRIEHPAVLESCKYLEEGFGIRVTYLPVDKYGSVDPTDVRDAIRDETVLITVMHANNEVGTIQPIEKIGRIARENGVLFHTDAAQSCGKIDVDVNKLNVDLLTIAGHKMYAPKGIGALYIRKGVVIDSYIHGAGHESGRRAGTENVPYMVGLGAASEIATKSLPSFGTKIKALRDKLFARIAEGINDGVRLNGHSENRLPNTLNISLRGIIGEELLEKVPGIAASTGSACHSGSFKPSDVLLEMGLSEEEALGALRLSLGRWTNEDEIEIASKLIVEQYNNIKTGQTRYQFAKQP
ncbi:MAG: cysteine desulfurase [Thaumarchaeota archaeon]|nr:cysteine desulfurase [Nitrososphaerota archaeon]